MTNNNPLTGSSLKGNESEKLRNIVIMLHGYGSNGNDLIQIAYELQKNFPYIFFSAPNAPFKFDNLPEAFKWFEVYPDGIPIDKASDKQKLKAVNDFNISCNLIEKHIYELSKKFQINLNKIFLLGFSQGSMMSIEVGTKLQEKIAGILSLSGRIYSENFNETTRNKIPILIVHGEKDEIIEQHRFYETCEILEKSNYKIEKHLIQNMGHTINGEVIEISKNFIKSYQ